jgi:predicted O-methyltransferase YrrM
MGASRVESRQPTLKAECEKRGLESFDEGRPFFPDVWGGILGPHRHLWLQAMVYSLRKLDRRISIVEAGSWIGGSALTFAESASRFCSTKASIICVDFWKPAEIHQETGFDVSIFDDEFAYRIFRHNASFANATVSILRGLTSECLPALREESFDIVYIDGSHYYREVLEDLQNGKVLTRTGGFLAGDDYELTAESAGLDLCQENISRDHVSAATGEFHPGVAMAVYEVLGRVPAEHGGFFAVRKDRSSFRPYGFDLDGFRPFVPRHFTESAAEAFVDYALSNGFQLDE